MLQSPGKLSSTRQFRLSFLKMIADHVRSLKASYLHEKEALEQRFFSNQGSSQFLKDHSELVDSLVEAIFIPQSSRCELALFATGGYGRRELFPCSDVDVLLVFQGKQKSLAEKAISTILHELWDTGLEIGHQVWSLEELQRLDPTQYQFALALLDNRPMGNPCSLTRRVQSEVVPAFFSAHERDLTQTIIELTRSRHEEFSNTVYQLEPDLKLAPGGLRDLHVSSCLTRLRGSPHYLPFTQTEIEASDEFLKRLRILLHLMNGRNDNRLTHRMQEKIRKYVGYRHAHAQAGVEALMKEYFLNARVNHDFCRAMLKAASPVQDSPDSGKIPEFKTMEDLLQAFQELDGGGRSLSDATREAVVAALPVLSTSLHFPSLRDRLRVLFQPRAGLYEALSAMYETGVLELLFPEFGSIKARVIWDFYHRYTVDEHTLLAIRSIEKLENSNSKEDGRFGTLLAETIDPSLLTLALLFHDVGKGRGGQHSDQSARMAARALRRFRFPAEDIDTIVFLIQNHLAISQVIFRRDLEDEQVIRRFADLIRSPEMLRLLTLLTYADIKAVAPGTLNEWKRDLLWQLYVAAYRKLTLEYGAERVEEDVEGRLLANRDADLDRGGLELFVEGFPVRYLRNTRSKEIYEHYRMAQRIDEENPIATRLVRDNAYYELWVVTPDRSHLFAKIAGMLSYFEMNILRGHGFANRQQTILDSFQFFDSSGHFRRSHEKARFQKLLRKAIMEEISVDQLLSGKENSVLFQRAAPSFSPSIYFEDEHSDRFTILEIVAPDALGLLYRISREISRLGCDIELALISTEGEKAVDVFYLCQDGGKLPTQLKQNLTDRIVQAIT